MEELQKSLRDQYSDNNEAYKAALASNGITPGNSTGKVRGIQQAYYDGTIDKGTRDYMMADAIAKFARNTGRDIGNIGAQFTGGTINNNFETSDWNKRNEELFKQQTSAEAGTIANSDKAMERRQQEANLTGKGLENEKTDISLETSRNLRKAADEAYSKGDKKTAYLLYFMASKGATSLSADELLTLLKFGDQKEPDYPEVRKDYPLEKFKQEFPNASEEDYEKLIRTKGPVEALKFEMELEQREQDIKDQQKKEEKALKEQQKQQQKQQKEQEAAAKRKAGYTNSYNNIMRDLNNGNKSSLTRAYNNFAGGRNPFDKNSFIDNKVMSSIKEQAQKILADNGQNWLNQNGTPSDDYMATVLKLALDNL